MARNLTDFHFFKDTPLVDFQNTIHFVNNEARDSFFLEENHYETIEIEKQGFNFIRDRSTVDVKANYKDFIGVNYATFLSDFEPDTRYYAFVMDVEYINDEVVRVYLLIDSIMTFTQGRVLQNLENLRVSRCHLNLFNYQQREWELKNNDDILKTSSKSYFLDNEFLFKDYHVIIQSAVDLTSDFGTVNNPIINTSKGLTYDKISSPLDLYVVKQKDFKEFMEKLSPFAWIAQNIRSVILVPENFLNNRLQGVSVHSTFGFDKLYKLTDGLGSNRQGFEEELKEINYSMDQLYQIFDLDSEQEKHLLRNEYGTVEAYSWDGQQLNIDLGQLNNETGLVWKAKMVMGFHNEVVIFPKNYQVENTEHFSINQNAGSFLNHAIYFSNFDDVPLLVDNYNLSLSKSANRRELAESKLATNRIENVFDKDADLKDRFFDAASLLSNFSVTNLFGKFTDEYEFYRQQKAEFADLALEAPTITSQSHSNALQMAENFFGLTLKFSKISASEKQRLKKYHGSFGFQINEDNTNLIGSIDSNRIANFLQFSGSWTLENVDVALVEQMKVQFENGVRFWHNNHTKNPMNQKLENNDIIR